MIDDVEIKIIQNKLERQWQTSITDFFHNVHVSMFVYVHVYVRVYSLARQAFMQGRYPVTLSAD